MAATFDFRKFFVVFDVLRPLSGRASRAEASLLALCSAQRMTRARRRDPFGATSARLGDSVRRRARSLGRGRARAKREKKNGKEAGAIL
eukprot:1251150-Pyramimonas_sp.AAC.1